MNRIEHQTPRFGIIIPVRLMPTELPGSIDSILEQTIDGRKVNTEGHWDVDLIVVVDDIDPDTKAVLDSYGDRIRWVEGDKRRQAGAINKGLQMTNGQLVKWVNADDRLLPGCLQAVNDAFSEDPQTAFVYGDVTFLDSRGNPVAEHLEPAFSKFILLYGHNLFADPTCFWRRDIHKDVGPIPEGTKYSMDYAFWINVIQANKSVKQIKRNLAAFKVTGQNLSIKNFRAMRNEHFDELSKHSKTLKLLPIQSRRAYLTLLLYIARTVKIINVAHQRKVFRIGRFGNIVASEIDISKNHQIK